MSKLIVTVENIIDIQPIPNADKIVLATVKGFSCIIGKDTYTIGQPIIFVPPDAILPEKLIEEQKLTFLKNGRVSTLKLRGVISQGLILPLTVLKGHTVQVGDDVANILGIKKYEVVVKSITVSRETISSLFKRLMNHDITSRRFVAKSVGIIYDRYLKPKKVSNSNFKEYTDIDNIKHYPTVFQHGEEVVITEKIHGTNFRAGKFPKEQNWFEKLLNLPIKYQFIYGSHHRELTPSSGQGYYSEDVYGKVAAQFNLKDTIPNGYCIYGEIFGENKQGKKIQELTYGEEGLGFRVFDVSYNGKYLSWNEFTEFCLFWNLPIVPLLYKGMYYDGIIKAHVDGNTTVIPKIKTFDGQWINGLISIQIREGCVIKPTVESYSNYCGRKILKCISADYLLSKKKDAPEEAIDDNNEFAH